MLQENLNVSDHNQPHLLLLPATDSHFRQPAKNKLKSEVCCRLRPQNPAAFLLTGPAALYAPAPEQNVCRHRGMILVEESKKLIGPITCPYHAWAYDFDGTLQATPHVGGPDIHEHHSVDCTALSLNEIPSAIWRDVIYVNLSRKATPFEEQVAALQTRWAEFEQELYFGGGDSFLSLMLPVTGS